MSAATIESRLKNLEERFEDHVNERNDEPKECPTCKSPGKGARLFVAPPGMPHAGQECPDSWHNEPKYISPWNPTTKYEIGHQVYVDGRLMELKEVRMNYGPGLKITEAFVEIEDES